MLRHFPDLQVDIAAEERRHMSVKLAIIAGKIEDFILLFKSMPEEGKNRGLSASAAAGQAECLFDGDLREDGFLQQTVHKSNFFVSGKNIMLIS